METLPSGKFRYRATINDQRITGPACRTKQQALKSFRDKLQSPSPFRGRGARGEGSPTLAQYTRATIEGPYTQQVQSNAMSPTTWALYETIARVHIETHHIGRRPIDKLTPADIEAWMHSLPVATNSKLRYLGFIAAVLNRAHRTDRLITSNPAADVKKPKQTPTDFEVLTPAQQQRLIELMPNQRLKIAAWLTLHGLSRSEACGLKLSDHKDGALTIRRQVQRIDGKLRVRERLKTPRRRATIFIDPELSQLIDSLSPPPAPRGRVREGGNQDSPFLLSTADGSPYAPDNLYRDFKKALKGTELEHLKPYDSRHTYAMSLLETGTDQRTAAELMRHSTRMLDRYVKSRDELKRNAAQRLAVHRQQASKQKAS